MIENLSWIVQKEGRFRTNTYLGSVSGSQRLKIVFKNINKTRRRDLRVAPAFCTLMVNHEHGLQNWTLSDGQTDSNQELFARRHQRLDF